MKKSGHVIAVPALLVMLTGCAVTPGTIVQGPTSVRPPVNAVGIPTNGAIFQAATYRPMFEDRRARMIGDILTIAISEKTSAAKSAATSGSKTGSAAFAAPTLFGVPATTTAKLGMTASTSNKFEEKGAESASNSFTGTIGVTVIDVYPNGNLLVSGEKQIAFDKGQEFIRFSGVVNPDTIASGNIVSSAQVADARFEYRTNSSLDKAEMTSMMARFFLSFLPM
ncbi:MAG TPA: flagellar basal body L-ring protein FlgH [Burkholderiaceae bacterium]|nr:flagellar basal body L-ring protein FlgH [Burkholderiaceae bacterium]